jgi:ribosome-binding factor A
MFSRPDLIDSQSDMDPRRNQRVAEALREELTEMIALELADPRLQGVTVTDIHLSLDSKTANIRLAIPGDETAQKAALQAMQNARGFLKKEIAARMELFRVPELRFEADLSPAVHDRMKHILKKIRKGRPRDASPTENLEKKPKP